jgi:hypothetical protein
MSQEIKPAYVTIEQAKLLKEKGFDVSVIKYWNGIGNYYDSKSYFNWNETDKLISIPEQWQVIEWLRINHGIWIYAKTARTMNEFIWCIDSSKDTFMHEVETKYYPTPQEAYSEAITYCLTNLI